MAAHISSTYQCPRCEEHFTAKVKPKRCPVKTCQYEFPEETGNAFEPPMTFYEQFVRTAKTPEDEQLMYKTVLNITVHKALGILKDAQCVIETISGKICRPSDIREVMETAKSIGEIATSYEAYLQARGKHVPSLYIKETSNELQTTAGTSLAASNAGDA